MDIYFLNNKNLVQIFSNLDIFSLLQAGKVSHRFQKIQRKVCKSRTRLTLIVMPEGKNVGCLLFNSPLVDPRQLDYETGRYQAGAMSTLRSTGTNIFSILALPAELPNLDTLHLCLDGVSSSFYWHVNKLLSMWSSLKELKLWLSYSDRDRGFNSEMNLEPTGNIYKLLAGVSRLAQLKHLSLDVRHYLLFVNTVNWNLPIKCASLEELSINNLEMTTKGSQVFAKGVFSLTQTIPTLKRIRLESPLFYEDNWNDLATIEGKVAKCITGVNLTECRVLEAKVNLKLVCGELVNLSYLSITVDPQQLAMWTKCLAALKQLKYLWLTMSFEDNMANYPVQRNVAQLKSVQVLKIDWYPSSSGEKDLANLHLSWICPCVEMVVFNYAGYISQCNASISKDNWLALTAPLLASMQNCRQLRRIYFTDHTSHVRDCAMADL